MKHLQPEYKSTRKSYEDYGGEAFNNQDWPQATFWFFMFKVCTRIPDYRNYTIAMNNLKQNKDYALFDRFLSYGLRNNSFNFDDLKYTAVQEQWAAYKANPPTDPYHGWGGY